MSQLWKFLLPYFLSLIATTLPVTTSSWIGYRQKGINYVDCFDYLEASPPYLAGLSTYSANLTSKPRYRRCRCLPDDPCWPTRSIWRELNATLDGQLLIPRPTGYPCYTGPGFNAAQCQLVKDSVTQSAFLSQNPGSQQYFNAEEDGQLRCSIEAASIPKSVCHRGRVSVYGVAVRSVAHIQKAILFAREYNLRLVVKSTGHDYLGRSAAPGSFLIWMHKFAKVQTQTYFVPSGCSAYQVNYGPVVTATGGITWDDLYAKVDEEFNNTFTVVGGQCYAIGAAGGLTLGGGHSAVSPSFGLTVDNVLQFQIVTADGRLFTASQCQNQDLFWALRGGGGGTFGVLVSATYRLHPVPHGFTAYSISITNADGSGALNATQVEDIVEVMARHTPELYKYRWGGFFFYLPSFGYSFILVTVNDPVLALSAVEGLKDEFVQIQNRTGIVVQPESPDGYAKHYSTFMEWQQWHNSQTASGHLYDSGMRGTIGSRLIPQRALFKPRSLAKNLVRAVNRNDPQYGLVGQLTIGPGVWHSSEAPATSATPAWRTATWQMILFNLWSFNATDQQVEQTKAALNAGLQVLRDAYPDSGSYLNEAFMEEPHWQRAFWGVNYDRLLRIKNAVDPDGLFVCGQCVGSEMWDVTGNCRTS